MNKIPVVKDAKIKEQVPKQIDKEGIGFKIYSCGFHKVFSLKWDVAWRWRSHLIKSQAKHKVRHAKHCHVNSVQGEKKLKLFKFSLIDN